MARLFFASLVTIGLLLGMVVGVIFAAMVATDQVDLSLAITLTIIINGLIWLVSPWITDFSLRWFNKLAWLDDATVKAKYPVVHQLTHAVADEYGFSAPSIGIIPDRNPTAFTYGLLRGNARIVLTEGLFEFLNEQETRAVVAHELGHIVNRDFIVMTAAGTLVQILYQVYAATTRAARGSDSKKSGGIVMVGIAALVMYYIGIFLLYYLSRTREYLADTFSAERVEARHLASALVKIAYGIVKVEDTEATQSLLRSTRHMGVIDVKNARHVGLVAESDTASPGQTAEAMLFHYYNPWARLIELNSTHPLTGMRIADLGNVAKVKGQQFGDYDIEAAGKRVGIDRGALRGQFWRELAILTAPIAAAIFVCLFGAFPLAPAAFAATVIATLYLRYPAAAPESTTVMALMTNPAASPVVGRPVRLEGTPIGRVNPGFFGGEDVIFQDKSGILPVDFRSMFGFLGDLYTGWRRIPKHLGKPGTVAGWFRRSMGGSIILKELDTTGGQLRARPFFWQALLCAIVIGVTIYFAAVLGPARMLRPLTQDTGANVESAPAPE